MAAHALTSALNSEGLGGARWYQKATSGAAPVVCPRELQRAWAVLDGRLTPDAAAEAAVTGEPLTSAQLPRMEAGKEAAAVDQRDVAVWLLELLVEHTLALAEARRAVASSPSSSSSSSSAAVPAAAVAASAAIRQRMDEAEVDDTDRNIARQLAHLPSSVSMQVRSEYAAGDDGMQEEEEEEEEENQQPQQAGGHVVAEVIAASAQQAPVVVDFTFDPTAQLQRYPRHSTGSVYNETVAPYQDSTVDGPSASSSAVGGDVSMQHNSNSSSDDGSSLASSASWSDAIGGGMKRLNTAVVTSFVPPKPLIAASSSRDRSSGVSTASGLSANMPDCGEISDALFGLNADVSVSSSSKGVDVSSSGVAAAPTGSRGMAGGSSSGTAAPPQRTVTFYGLPPADDNSSNTNSAGDKQQDDEEEDDEEVEEEDDEFGDAHEALGLTSSSAAAGAPLRRAGSAGGSGGVGGGGLTYTTSFVGRHSIASTAMTAASSSVSGSGESISSFMPQQQQQQQAQSTARPPVSAAAAGASAGAAKKGPRMSLSSAGVGPTGRLSLRPSAAIAATSAAASGNAPVVANPRLSVVSKPAPQHTATRAEQRAMKAAGILPAPSAAGAGSTSNSGASAGTSVGDAQQQSGAAGTSGGGGGMQPSPKRLRTDVAGGSVGNPSIASDRRGSASSSSGGSSASGGLAEAHPSLSQPRATTMTSPSAATATNGLSHKRSREPEGVAAVTSAVPLAVEGEAPVMMTEEGGASEGENF